MWAEGAALVEVLELVDVALDAGRVAAGEFLVALGLDVGFLFALRFGFVGFLLFLDGIVVFLFGHGGGGRELSLGVDGGWEGVYATWELGVRVQLSGADVWWTVEVAYSKVEIDVAHTKSVRHPMHTVTPAIVFPFST